MLTRSTIKRSAAISRFQKVSKKIDAETGAATRLRLSLTRCQVSFQHAGHAPEIASAEAGVDLALGGKSRGAPKDMSPVHVIDFYAKPNRDRQTHGPNRVCSYSSATSSAPAHDVRLSVPSALYTVRTG